MAMSARCPPYSTRRARRPGPIVDLLDRHSAIALEFHADETVNMFLLAEGDPVRDGAVIDPDPAQTGHLVHDELSVCAMILCFPFTFLIISWCTFSPSYLNLRISTADASAETNRYCVL